MNTTTRKRQRSQTRAASSILIGGSKGPGARKGLSQRDAVRALAEDDSADAAYLRGAAAARMIKDHVAGKGGGAPVDHLRTILGRDAADTLVPAVEKRSWGTLNSSQVRAHAYDMLAGVHPDAKVKLGSAEEKGRIWEPDGMARQDPDNMVTEATATVKATGPFDTLAPYLNPLAWQLQPFWLRSDWVEIAPDGSIVPEPGAPSRIPDDLEEPHSGLLFEFAEWEWGGASLAGFQALLNIRFRNPKDVLDDPEVFARRLGDRDPDVIAAVSRGKLDELRQISMIYSLQRAVGFMMLGHIDHGGVDVDSGYMHGVELENRSGDLSLVAFGAMKRVRFDDVTTRRTGGQGAAQMGDSMNFTGPTIVSQFIEDGVYSSLARWSRGLPVDSKLGTTTGD